MNLKQYWQFFKIAVSVARDPYGMVFTDDRKVYDKVREKLPKARIIIYGKGIKR